MPATLTIENIPDIVYERLSLVAQAHSRSVGSQAIVCLESALVSARPTSEERIARARELRAALPAQIFFAHDIDIVKRAGRK